MSDTIENILVKDPKGGQNITCQPYKAISHTTANHV